MITEIKLKGITSYKNEVIIPELKKLNFFFGSNGSGKSTIAKYLYNLSLNEDNRLLNISNCNQNGYNPIENEILVYDENFIKRNFIDKDSLNGIFSLNEKNAIIDDIIEKEKDKIKNWKICISKLEIEENNNNEKSTELYEGKNGILQKCWNLRNNFNDNFKKMPVLEHSKSKENNFKKIISILKKNEEKEIDYEVLKNDYQKLFEKEISKIEKSFNIELYRKIRRLEVKINEKLRTPFTGNKDVDIANMIEFLGIQNWVEERWNNLDKSISIQKCPFCQVETINQDLIEQFEKYFDRTYQEKKDAIQLLKKQYNDFVNQFIDNLNSLKTNFPKKSELNLLSNTLERFFEKQDKIIQNKLDNTNEILMISNINIYIEDFKKVINLIFDNNEDFEKLDEKRQELITKIWNYLAYHSKEFVDDYNVEKIKIVKRLRQIKEIIFYIKNEKILKSQSLIDKKRKETANTDTALKEINEILKNIGFVGFTIEKEDETENNISRYYLKRPNENVNNVFNTLSEGEKNLIAFLYFYWLCKGTDDQEKKGDKKKIIIIDDPVSSLDSQVLFLVTTLIRELAKKKGKSPNHLEFALPNIEQIYILSHNIYFFKEASLEFGSKLCQNVNYFQINKINEVSTISKLKENNINSDYNLLWRGLYNLKNSNDASMNIVISNLMRRILQSYIHFTKVEKSEWTVLNNLPPEEPKRIIFSALISQINDDSHHSSPFEEMHYQKISNTTPELLFEVFEMIFDEIGKEHKEAIIKHVTT